MLSNRDKEKYEKALGAGWEIRRCLGEGSYGSVYEIERNDLGILFRSALKIISIPKNDNELREIMSEMTDEESVRIYFESVAKELTSELSVMATLKGYTNIVNYEDHLVLRHDDNIGMDILIRMELLTPLLVYINKHTPDTEFVLRLGIDMCNALSVCERNNIIHRDIKPANIFVSDTGDFKLGDFGVAKIVERATASSSVGAGTPDYMAPEIRLCVGKYGNNVDIYSLGTVLYQLSNHMRLPFYPRYPEPIYAENKEEAAVRRLRGDRLPAPDDAGKNLSAVILKACSYNPNNRYSSSEDMAADLIRISENKPPYIHNYRKMILVIGIIATFISISIGIVAYKWSRDLSESVSFNSIDEKNAEEEIEYTADTTSGDESIVNDTKGIENDSIEIESDKSFVEEKEFFDDNISENSVSDDDSEKVIINYEEAYAPVLDEYKRLLENPNESADETKVPNSFVDKVRLYSLGIDDIFYVFHDLDNNDIDEMIILNRSFGNDYVCAVYSLENEHIIPIDFSAGRLERDGIYLFNDKIVEINLGGTGYVKKCFCRLNPKTFDWSVVETIVMLCGQDGISKYYKSKAQESMDYDPDDSMEIYKDISEEEMNATENKYEIEAYIDRKPLSNYRRES